MKFSNMSKHVETCSDSIWYKLLQFIEFSNMSEHVQTCLNLFRFIMILIVTIHAILKHVWTCSNMSKLVQIQYDMNCYDSCVSQTCSGSTWYELIQFLNMSRLEMKTWWNTLKLSKWHKKVFFLALKSNSLDRFEQVERSKTYWIPVKL